MSKFKVGYKVRCVDNTHWESHLTVGNIYTVRRISYGYGKCYLRIKPDNDLDDGGYESLRFELVEPNPVLTPEEVFEHLRKGTKMQRRQLNEQVWWDDNGNPPYKFIVGMQWRVKPEPEVIELNGKRYKLIEE